MKSNGKRNTSFLLVDTGWLIFIAHTDDICLPNSNERYCGLVGGSVLRDLQEGDYSYISKVCYQ